MCRSQLHIVSAKTWGGGESYVFNLARYSIQQGDTVIIVTDSRYPEISRRFSKITKPIEIHFSFGSIISNVLKLRNLVKSNAISSVNYHSGKVALLAVLTSIASRVPCVFFKHNISIGKSDAYHNFLIRHSGAIVCVSKTVKNTEIQGIKEQFRTKVHSVYSGVFLPENVSRKKGKRVRIGYAGRIVQNKGINVLLEAVQKLPISFDLVIAGHYNSTYGERIKAKFSGSRIHFVGEMEDLGEFYRNIDIFVAPSIVPEAFGLSICEAMSYSLPVVTTTSGAQSELIKDWSNGVLIPPDNVKALQDSLLQLSRDEKRMNMIGMNARKSVEDRFTIDKLYLNLNRIYHSLCDS